MTGSRASRPRRRAPEDKRARILEAATQLFGERGYEQVPTSEIARTAQVSEGIIYHHFESKAGLLRAVARAFGSRLSEAMFGDAPIDTPPDVHGMIGRCFDFVEEHGEMHKLLVSANDPTIALAFQAEEGQAIIDALTERFLVWHGLGYIETPRPEIAASLMFGLVEYAMFDCFKQAPVGHSVPRDLRDVYLDETVRIIQASLRPNDGSPPESGSEV